MFLVFTLVLLVVAVGILASVYSVFFPFMQNLGTVQQYHMAYYGAVSAIERAELSLKYRQPGFEWSWGFLWLTWYGPLSDYTPDLFSWTDKGFIWNVRSRTNTIPSPGMWNTDLMLSDPVGDSDDYNVLWYTYLETFLLSYDATTSIHEYYTWGNTSLQYFDGTQITWTLRLPPYVHSLFWSTPGLLCYSYVWSDCDPDGDGIYDDIVVSWSMEWLYNGQWFKIFPTITVFYYSGMQIDTYKDNALRESLINTTGFLNFTTTFTPVVNGSHLTKHTVVSQNASAIETNNFFNIFQWYNFSWLRLSFGAANLFRTMTGAIYPYLEYQFHFPEQVSDRFYTIQWNGRVGEYDVQIILKKPTVQWIIWGDFTVIF